MITTHILDLSAGKPASGVRVALARLQDGRRTPLGSGVTDSEGRLREIVKGGAGQLDAGIFELTFETGVYFTEKGIKPFHPRVTVTVEITDAGQHYHVPLLISPYGYTTYRGS